MPLYRNVRLVFDDPVTPDGVRDEIRQRLAGVGRDVQHVTNSAQAANILTIGVFIEEDTESSLTADVQEVLQGLDGFRGCPPFVSPDARGTSMG